MFNEYSKCKCKNANFEKMITRQWQWLLRFEVVLLVGARRSAGKHQEMSRQLGSVLLLLRLAGVARRRGGRLA